ncbi:MAG: hypothetical protein F4X44_12605 [Gammaproteobacteria bacterium]|nr:hypothetical protein [Gammaproteobacteria bacterium]MYD81436.1 hypothetical protein [Gammaproteobacteria bacterium]
MTSSSNNSQTRWSTTGKLTLARVALVVVTICVVWLFVQQLGASQSDAKIDEELMVATSTEDLTKNPLEPLSDQGPELEMEDVAVVLTPERTILNVDCRMLSGKGAAEDVAVVTILSEEGAEFAVLDKNGTLTSDRLDFRPHHFRIGRRPDGSVLVGFANLRLNSGVFRPPDSDEPLRIYHGDHVVYETNKASDFDIAVDGSSFFVLEPSPGGESRLVIRNMGDGTQKEIELGTRFSSSNAFSPGEHVPVYSADSSEIMFTPAHADAMGIGTYWIYPVGEGRARRITVQDSQGAWLTSSENGYVVDRPDGLALEERGDVWQVTRKRFDLSIGGTEVLWSSRVYVKNHYGMLSLSQNGRWLGLSGWNYKVLDTNTGETVFDFPRAPDRKAVFARLAPVLPEGATLADVGRIGNIRFKGNSLVSYRMVGDASPCSTKKGEKYDNRKWRECIRELRLQDRYRTYYDVFDMSNTQIDGPPAYITEVFEESNCMPANSPRRGLVDLDGQLAFRPQQDSSN